MRKKSITLSDTNRPLNGGNSCHSVTGFCGHGEDELIIHVDAIYATYRFLLRIRFLDLCTRWFKGAMWIHKNGKQTGKGETSLLVIVTCYSWACYHAFILILIYSYFSVFAVSVINPLELVRTKMQSRPLTFSELAGCVKTAVQDGGVLSLWRGWGPTILRDVPFSCKDMKHT